MTGLKRTVLLYLLTLALAACGAPADDGPALPLAEVSATPLPPTSTPSATAIPPSPSPSPTASATPSATATPTPQATATATPTPRPASIVVAYVPADEQLNVRAAPGADAEAVATWDNGQEVEISGRSQESGDQIWLPVTVGEDGGWVNGLYLTELPDPETFCDAEGPRALVEAFREALAAGDEEALAELVDPRRGLRVRWSWWNPEVRLAGAEAEALLSGGEGHDWGVQDGSGNPIRGSFRDVILPMLERDLLPAEEVACNEILHGGTAGLVQLPEAYQGLNYYTFYRPAGPDQVEMDWGSWVVGVERWQGSYRIAFLVHYAWEI